MLVVVVGEDMDGFGLGWLKTASAEGIDQCRTKKETGLAKE